MIVEYEFFQQYANKFAMIAPCTVSAEYMYVDFSRPMQLSMEIANLFSIGGPTWPRSITRTERLLGRTTTRDLLATGWGSRLNDVAMKSLFHYAENGLQQRFQTYSDTYWNYINPQKVTDLIDLSIDKTIPVGFFIGENEDTCLLPQSELNRQALGDMC